jgi:hypothetical protein
MSLAMFSAFLVVACSNSMPPLVRGLPRSFGPTSDFGRRIAPRYPIGSEEAKLHTELRSERFAITESADATGRNQRLATYERVLLPCKEPWTVRWVYDHGIIKEVDGRYSGDLCL